MKEHILILKYKGRVDAISEGKRASSKIFQLK
jgi:hypothetical protein